MRSMSCRTRLLQMRDLSQPDNGLKLNWTIAQAGTSRNVVPPHAQAQADVRALRAQDFQALQDAVQEKIKNRLLEGSQVTARFEPAPPADAGERRRTPHRRAGTNHLPRGAWACRCM